MPFWPGMGQPAMGMPGMGMPGMGMPGMGMPGMGMPGMGMPGMGMPGMGMPSLPMLQEAGVTRQKPMQTEEVTVDDVMNLLVESLGMFFYIFKRILSRARPELLMPIRLWPCFPF